MDEGLLIKAKNFLLKRKEPELLPTLWRGFSKGAIQPTDFAAHISSLRDTVYTCVRLNADGVASVPLHLYIMNETKGKQYKITKTAIVPRKQMNYLSKDSFFHRYISKGAETEEILNHPLLDLLYSVNGFLSLYDLIDLTVQYLDLCGNCYWWLIPNALGVPAEIRVVPAEFMKPIPDEEKFISGYIYKRGTKTKEFKEEEIIHFRNVYPGNMFFGLGALMGCIDSYEMRQNMIRFEKVTFENMGVPDALITSEQNLSQVEHDRMETYLKANFGGVENTGNFLFLSGQNLKFERLGFAPREMSFLGGRGMTKEDIGNAFGVPKSKLTTDDVNLANAKAGNYSHAKNGLLPRCRRIETKLTEKLCPKFLDGDRLFLAFDDVVPEDIETELKRLETHIKTGVSTIDEEREVLDKAPLGIDRPLQPMTNVPVGRLEQSAAMEEFAAVMRIVREKIGTTRP